MNLHGVSHKILSLARLPVPPRSHCPLLTTIFIIYQSRLFVNLFCAVCKKIFISFFCRFFGYFALRFRLLFATFFSIMFSCRSVGDLRQQCALQELTMNKIGFDNEKYLSMQSEHIRKRVDKFGDKLYSAASCSTITTPRACCPALRPIPSFRCFLK